MSERYTSVGPRLKPSVIPADVPWPSGIADHGRKTRAEMIAQYRSHYEHQKAEAELALSMADDELIVETYLGPYAMSNCREVTE